MKKVFLQELSAPGCQICKQFEVFWHSVEKDFPEVEYQNIDLTTSEGQELVQKHSILASPGIILNGELFSTGGFNKEKFLQKLKEISQ